MSSFNESMERVEQAAHHTGRSEMGMEVSRLLYFQIQAVNDRITARTLELNKDTTFTGYISDDVKLKELIAMREVLDSVHVKVLSL